MNATRRKSPARKRAGKAPPQTSTRASIRVGGTKIGEKKPSSHYARYLKLVSKFPGVEESISYGTPSVKVKGKILSRLRTEAEGALALHCDFVDREMLLQAAPEVFFVTDHYRNYPMILIRLDKVRADALPDLIERAWRMRAPAKLVAQYDKDHDKDSA
jgi:hypothetical protein